VAARDRRPHAWIVIEKILAVDEPLEPTLPVAGTTGMTRCAKSAAVHRSRGVGPLTALSNRRCRYDEMPQLARAQGPTLSPTPWAANWPAARAIVAATASIHPTCPGVAELISRSRVPLRLPVAVVGAADAMAETAARYRIGEPLRSSPRR
jgi:(1->4)-alpha-D-glucan 1-alpha-D-glucosylmutase